MCDGTSSYQRPNLWHFSLRDTMSLHLLHLESVTFLLTCYLTQCVCTSSLSHALTASTGKNYLSLRSVTYVLRTCYVHLYLCSHTCILRENCNNSICSYVMQHVFLNVSHSLRFTGLLSVLQRSYVSSGHSIKITYRHRSLRSTKIWRTTLLPYLQYKKRMLKSVTSIHLCKYRCWNSVIILSCEQQVILRFRHTHARWLR
jgi:hypothetical protein